MLIPFRCRQGIGMAMDAFPRIAFTAQDFGHARAEENYLVLTCFLFSQMRGAPFVSQCSSRREDNLSQ